MCHNNRGPRCAACHKPAPRHRCRCPAEHASDDAANTQHDRPPPYATVIDQQAPTSTLPSVPSVPSRLGHPGYGGCGYQRRHCRGPIHLLVNLIIRKVQEKKEKGDLVHYATDERDDDDGAQGRGVVEAMDEKRVVEGREVEREGKDEDVKVLTKSVRSISP